MSREMQSFVGVDLHKCTVSLAAVNGLGEKIAGLKISTKSVGKIEEWLSVLPQPLHLAVEACPFVEWFIERFRPCVERIDIADATELANRRGKRRKTDRNDSLDIAQRLARGECPLGYIAPPDLMQLRKLGRHWRHLSRLLSRTKHSMKSMLNAANIRGPKFDGASAQRWLLANRDLLGAVQQDAFADFIDVLMLVERQRERMRRQMIFASRSGAYAPTIARLMTVPGIAEIWATTIAAEIGPFERFPNADALEFWAGLTADMKESAGRTQSGPITKAGSATLRWALGQAALTLCQSDARQEATRQRLIARVGKPRANVAMARRLLRILYAMMRDGKAYQGGPKRDRTAAANKARLRRKTQAA
jgi:transposase